MLLTGSHGSHQVNTYDCHACSHEAVEPIMEPMKRAAVWLLCCGRYTYWWACTNSYGVYTYKVENAELLRTERK